MKWNWTETQQAPFDKAKSLLQSYVLPAYYDQSKNLVLAYDTSLYGMGWCCPNNKMMVQRNCWLLLKIIVKSREKLFLP